MNELTGRFNHSLHTEEKIMLHMLQNTHTVLIDTLSDRHAVNPTGPTNQYLLQLPCVLAYMPNE